VSPSKRVNFYINSDLDQIVLDEAKSEVASKVEEPCKRTITDIPLRIRPGWRLNIESDSSDSSDSATTMDSDGPSMLCDHTGRLPTPPSPEHYECSREHCVPSMIMRDVDNNPKDTEFPPLDETDEGDIEEFGYLLSSKEYVKLYVSVRVTQCKLWAKVIEVSCTYGGVEVASTFGHLICRELIRDNFYESMDILGTPVSDKIDELLDHHGYFRWSIKEHYLGKKAGKWSDALDKGSMLQIDEVLVHEEWQSQALELYLWPSFLKHSAIPYKQKPSSKSSFPLPNSCCLIKQLFLPQG